MEIRIHRDQTAGESPVYRQIAEQIGAAIEDGRLAEGDRLPPIRDLAKSVGVNRDTVALAYEELAAEGRVEARVGRGTFVRGRRPRGPLERGVTEPPFSAVVDRLLDYERTRTPFPRSGDPVPFHSLVPDARLFPVDAFRRAVNRAFADAGSALLLYGGPQGHAGLREVMAQRLQASGVGISPDSLVLCQGAAQGISLALRLFAAPGETIAVEAPTYQNVLGTLIGLGLRAVPVPMRADGPDLDALDSVLRRPEVKLFYTIPTFHNPMGISTSLAHRRGLLEIAERYGKPVIEDAFEMDLRFTGRPVPPLAGLDEAGLVVQLVSFSKSLFPGVRAGAVVARGRAVAGLLALKHATDLGGALPLQAALADFVRTGAYDRHLVALRKTLRRRRDVLLAALEARMPEGTRWTTPEGGYQVWVELPGGLDSRALFDEAVKAGVLYAPGEQFHADGRASGGMRLTIAQTDEDTIERGVDALAGVVKRELSLGNAPPRVAAVNM